VSAGAGWGEGAGEGEEDDLLVLPLCGGLAWVVRSGVEVVVQRFEVDGRSDGIGGRSGEIGGLGIVDLHAMEGGWRMDLPWPALYGIGTPQLLKSPACSFW
jgi:hypothetical protein